jgi:hypothetical protein
MKIAPPIRPANAAPLSEPCECALELIVLSG